MPDGEVVTPGIRDAERFQGFDADWTLPANEWRAGRDRWRLVGNAVTVNVAQWIGERLLQPTPYLGIFDTPLPDGAKWPSAAYNVGEGRFYAQVSKWPIMVQRPHLHEFICKTEAKPLSRRAIAGFLARYHAGSLRKSARFLEMLAAHQTRMETLYRESAA
jgi:DNA (cytosine-5)-methyltransferase 1